MEKLWVFTRSHRKRFFSVKPRIPLLGSKWNKEETKKKTSLKKR